MRPNASSHRVLDASSILRNSIQKVMQEWARKVRAEIPAAASLDEEALYNGLPEFLASLVNVISTTPQTPGGERFVTENRENCKNHGTQRARNASYTLDQVIQEYKLLRETLFEVLESEQRLTLIEQRKILGAIDCGITEAASEFAALRGFPDARIKKAEDERNDIQIRLNESQCEIGELKEERGNRDKFVSMLAHDLRTPLTAAKVSAQLIFRQLDSQDVNHSLAKKIVTNIDRTDSMIRDLLDASRIRAGEGLPLHLESMDLADLARNTLKELSDVYGDRFVLNSPMQVSGFWSPQDLRRILENLLTNAVKYGDPFSPITLVIHEQHEKVILSVHNRGRAIPSETQAELFGQYKRSKSAKESEKQGWGLGLTLVEGIAHAHNGSVRVESSQSDGTDFIVELPRDSRTLQ